MGRAPLIALVVGTALFAQSAAAHHPVALGGPDGAVPRSRVTVQLSAAEFDLGEAQRGTWRSETLVLQHLMFERLALAAQIGAAHVQFRDGAVTNGPTDVELSVAAIVLGSRTGSASLVLSMGFELPTGRVEHGLGDGHFSGSPSIAVTLRPHADWLLSLSLHDHFPFGSPRIVDPGHPAPEATPQHAAPSPDAGGDNPALAPVAHGSVLAPHHSHEIRGRATVSYLFGPLYATSGMEITGVVSDGGLLGPVALLGELGAYPIDSLRVAAGVDVQIAGELRLPWTVRLRADYLF